MREILFGLALMVCAVFVVVGIAHWSHGAAWVVAGVLGSLVAYLALADNSTDPVAEGEE
jgi:hypothetical protein